MSPCRQRKVLGGGILLVVLAGCTVSQLKLPADPVKMTIVQRCSHSIPGSHDTVRVHLDDITEGQVLLSIRGMNNQAILDTASVEPGDVVPFRLGTHTYYLSVIELRNIFAGDDFGVFEVSTKSPAREGEAPAQ